VLSLRQFLTFGATAWALIVIPGPSVLFVVTRGIALGRRAALATVVGNTTGQLVHVAAVALGVGVLVARSVTVFNVMKIAGALYLAYLGLRTIRGAASLKLALAGTTAPRSTRRLLGEGFVVGVTNPKTTIFFLAVLPQFVDRSRGHVSLQLLLLGLVFAAIAVLSDSSYALAAGSVRRWFDRRPERTEKVSVTSGLVMIGLGVRLALVGRAD
jgi:threonine/homoserine/homoserine lactone efflux protein